MTTQARLRAAVTVEFVASGVMYASLFTRMPALKSHAGLSDGELAVGLLAGSVGLLLSQPATGALASRVGSRRLVGLGALLYGGLLCLPALAAGTASFAGAMFVLGAGSGVLDVAMNAQGVLAEARHTRRIFSAFHATFSLGALGGSLAGGLAAGLGIAPVAHLAVVGALSAAAGVAATAWMLDPSADAGVGAPAFARPTRALLALGAIGFCALMTEGAVGDWSAVLLSDVRGASGGLAAGGLAAFSVTMALGRLAADPLADRHGPAAVVRGGALTAIAGLILALVPLGAGSGIAGFGLMGAGVAALFPLALGAAGRSVPAGPAAGVAAVSTTAYAGFLAGPALIGGLAELTTLPAALALLIPLCAVVLATARAVSVGTAG